MSNLITVTSNADSGIGSLREAITSAQLGDTIQFDPTLANQTITLTSGQLVVDKDLTIDGAEAPGLTISGNNTYRIFEVEGVGINFTLQNLILANGFTEGEGGAILTGSTGALPIGSGTISTLIVENVEFNNNVASAGGAIFGEFRSDIAISNSKFDSNNGITGTSPRSVGGARSGGAIAVYNESTLTVRDSEFTNNKGLNGGAINSLLTNLTVENSTFINNDSTAGGSISQNRADDTGYGGAIFTDGASDFSNDDVGGTITIRNSRFEGNIGAGQGGGLYLFAYPPDNVIVEDSTIINNQVIRDIKGDAYGGGLRLGNAELTISNTTFANNVAELQGGGLWVGENSPVTITNSTFSGNRADILGEDGVGGAITISTQNFNATNIVNTTFAGNYAGGYAGAIFSSDQPITVENSLFYNNTAGNPFQVNQQTNRELTDGGNNLQFPGKLTNDPNDPNITATITIADPKLGPLQDNGSGILTHALLPGSPAIDAGNNAIAPTTDQRGVSRPQDGDNNGTAIVDIGAYEVSDTLPTPTPTLTPTPTPTPTLTPTPTPTPTPSLTKNSNDVFVIEGNTGQAQLQFQLTASNTNFVNEVGIFALDDDSGRVNGIAPSEVGYREAALSNAQVIFSALAGNQFPDLRTTRQLSFDVSTRLGFYLVPNSTHDAVQVGKTSPDNVFFFSPQANADNFDHLQVSELGNGSFNLAWEESFGGGDADFNDLALAVQLTNNPPLPGTGLQGGEQRELIDLRDSVTGLVPGQITVNSEAYYNNSFGFYAVDDPTGRIGNLKPSDSGYAATAISGRVDVSAGLPGGKLLVPFLIANGTPEQFLAGNPNNQLGVGMLAYFPYLGANPDAVDHVRLLGDNVFGFEDLLGGGDADFNDVVLQVNFA